ncbi:MAG TPA: ROK family protein [Chryseosolibacter sp.]|nr:ROK family protein [Chryseosolibacter sp.]
MRTFLGIEIGGTKLQLVVGNEHARILERFRFVVNPEQGAEGIRKQIRAALDKISLHSVSAIGIGFGGPVDHQTGKILTSYQIPGWGDFILQDWLEKLTRIPVWLDNDANVAALGESLYGAGKDSNVVFYVTMGSGVGAGIVVNNVIYHGSRNSEAEFGHLRLDKTGRTIESSCSGWAVDEKIRAYVKENPGTLLDRLTKDYPRAQARALLPALAKNDDAAIRILDTTVDDLALGLSHVVHLVNPNTIILGGGLSLIGESLRRRVEQKLPPYLMDVLRPGPSIQLSSLKEDAVPVGALALAMNKIIAA